MKKYLLIILIFCFGNGYCQKIDYCNYFKLEVSQNEYKGKLIKSISPVIIINQNDDFTGFLKSHQQRFEYILFKYFNLYKDIANFYPDTNKMQTEFCKKILYSDAFDKYFRNLSPKKLTAWNGKKDKFSINEMMQVASKFFYCDAINTKDTSIQSHVCVGINGISEINSKKDFTLLEAFCIEAILTYIFSENNPVFYDDFYSFKKHAMVEKKKNFRSFEQYLNDVRQDCYKKMYANKDLKEKLLQYYKANKQNFNFSIH